ncbi:MAG: S9 family peptidase [Flavobacteriales bacterium]|nr:S9 family peptidase [Flavobacteriales bacterium]
MRTKLHHLLIAGAFPLIASAQGPTIPVTDNLVAEGIPPLPASLISEVRAYTEGRGAGLAAWHPVRKEMLISTRFGNTSQLHQVRFPGGARMQITFYEDAVGGANYEPNEGRYFLFNKDAGGNEFSQLYRMDADGKATLLTDGKRSQNGRGAWSRDGKRIAYSSTMRNGKDRDIRVMDPLDPATDRVVAENSGGGWGISDWSIDDKQLLIGEGISVNESRIYVLDIATGVKTRLLPLKDERTTYRAIAWNAEGTGIFLTSNKDSEFNRLCIYDLRTRKLKAITESIPWDVGGVELAHDRSRMAFTTNEDGLSKLYLLDTRTLAYEEVPGMPVGLIGGLSFTKDGRALGLTLTTHASTSDVFELDLASGKLLRWTESELGGMDVSGLRAPELVKWPSFDKRTISGYLYRPHARFTGKRPVIINIHGGPEGQSRPGFQGRNNYYLNELGVAIIYPNVRGSSGYGKTFLDLDNGYKREESVKDIGALLDWIATQPDLDADRVMVTGGSYGGYMTLAVSVHYADRIRCALDVVGISNFNTFLKNTEDYRRDLRRVEYGDERDPKMAAFLEGISPLNRAEKITKPLFIVQGGNDPRVPASEAVQMKERIKEKGGTVWFLMANDEGHGFRKKGNSDFQFYATIAFVREHLLK